MAMSEDSMPKSVESMNISYRRLVTRRII